MSATSMPRYGTPNWELVKAWLATPPEQDGRFWAINLMKYRPIADYADGRETTLTGKEADDVYVPYGPLAAVGAAPVFGAEVTRQLGGDPQWDRIGIATYPTRAAFFEMQQRPDFLELHVHKDAGMEFTIVFASHPVTVDDLPAEGDIVLRVRRFAPGAQPGPDPEGVTTLARFSVEGVIVGDPRTWDEATFDVVPDGALEALLEVEGVEEQFVMVLGPREMDELAASVAQAQV